jgi:hypothetical protein
MWCVIIVGIRDLPECWGVGLINDSPKGPSEMYFWPHKSYECS